MKITTAEIAKRAGVSPATVSRVISGGNVSDEKRNAVLAVLNESAPQRIRPRKKRGSEICYIGMLILDTSGYDTFYGNLSEDAIAPQWDLNWSNAAGDRLSISADPDGRVLWLSRSDNVPGSTSPSLPKIGREEAEAFTPPEGKNLCIVSQTTFNYNKFQLLVEIITKKSYSSIVVNTICSATHERQAEARRLASQVDVMLVIGGKHSSNTQKLCEICKKECGNTYFIQTVRDLQKEWLEGKRSVGITAGASTPNHIIEEVQRNVRFKF